jgi:hypothetical protein
MKNDPIDNHGRAIIDIIPKLLELELPAFSDYLNSRVLNTPMLKRIDKGCIIEKIPE